MSGSCLSVRRMYSVGSTSSCPYDAYSRDISGIQSNPSELGWPFEKRSDEILAAVETPPLRFVFIESSGSQFASKPAASFGQSLKPSHVSTWLQDAMVFQVMFLSHGCPLLVLYMSCCAGTLSCCLSIVQATSESPRQLGQ